MIRRDCPQNTGGAGTMMVRCPLIDKDIDEFDCFETGTVAEGLAAIRSSVGIEEIKRTENFRIRCLACENHIM